MIFGLTVALVVLFTNHNIDLARRRAGYQNKLEQLEKEREALQAREDQLAFQIEASGQEAYLERVARERLNLKRPGEQVVVFEMDEEEPVSVEPDSGESIWQRIGDRVRGWFRRQ